MFLSLLAIVVPVVALSGVALAHALGVRLGWLLPTAVVISIARPRGTEAQNIFGGGLAAIVCFIPTLTSGITLTLFERRRRK